MSLYLKYRPLDFNNLEGQSFIKNTLQKAIENKKTVGAYLFCGPRGTGKTSTARILAKTINCENPSSGNPCLKCNICKDFLDERLVDIIEIDAASHTGVDNIREIIEKAQFSPTRTKFKIYIIDEVHMLSKGAFNALLKILEEPPKHVKFILATTETHKVPETIISRCQRYDFKRISDDDIRNRLNYIALEESVKADEKSINYIIKNSSGGLRNAISLFEQLISDGKLDYDIIVSKLEIVDDDIVKSFLDKLLNSDRSVIEIFDKLVSDGKNIKLFFKELLFFTKDESLNKLNNGEDIKKYINILEVLDDSYAKTKNSLDENITFLVGLLKIITGFSPVVQEISIGESKKIKKIESSGNKDIKNTILVEKKVEEELSHDALNDIFGNNENQNIVTASAIQNNGEKKSDFNLNDFISQLKSKGAKGGLTMALRGSNISLDNNVLQIGVKTKIAKGQFENSENSSLIILVLSDIGIINPQIKING